MNGFSGKGPSRRVREQASRLAESLRGRGAGEARAALVLGSGLRASALPLEDRQEIPFQAVPGAPRSAVPGHAGRFVLGRLAGATVLVQEGRVHLYEGWSPFDVTRTVRAYVELGIDGLVLTNSAGAVRPGLGPGALLVLVDHLNLQGRSPLLPGEAACGRPYDASLREILVSCGRELGHDVHEGVYAGLLGPSYETPAEIRMLQRLHADAVGMSTVAEAATARALGMPVAGVACISNLAAGLQPEPLAHADVVEVARETSRRLAEVLVRALEVRFGN